MKVEFPSCVSPVLRSQPWAACCLMPDNGCSLHLVKFCSCLQWKANRYLLLCNGPPYYIFLYIYVEGMVKRRGVQAVYEYKLP